MVKSENSREFLRSLAIKDDFFNGRYRDDRYRTKVEKLIYQPSWLRLDTAATQNLCSKQLGLVTLNAGVEINKKF